MKQSIKTSSLLFVLGLATIATLGAVGGTNAKYSTTVPLATGDGTDKGVVAVWNVGKDSTTGDLFSQQINVATVSTGSKLIAPGTTGTKTYIVTGKNATTNKKTEVAYEVYVKNDAAVTVTNDLASGGLIDKLKFTLKTKVDSANAVDKGNNLTPAQLQTALRNITSGANSLKPAWATDTGGEVRFIISWNWPLAGTDATDTDLGEKAQVEANAPTVAIDFDAVIDQLD